jgi:hypothetical protein
MDVVFIAALAGFGVQLACIHKALVDLRTEISSARWEMGRMARLSLPGYKSDESFKSIGRKGADSLD